MTPDARAFAEEWVDAFNAHDLDRILSHYADDVRLRSPLAARVTGHRDVEGKAALRAYFAAGLKLRPDLKFTLRRAYRGADSVVIEYDALDGRIGSEFMQFDDQGRVARVAAHYA